MISNHTDRQRGVPRERERKITMKGRQDMLDGAKETISSHPPRGVRSDQAGLENDSARTGGAMRLSGAEDNLTMSSERLQGRGRRLGWGRGCGHEVDGEAKIRGGCGVQCGVLLSLATLGVAAPLSNELLADG
jgi:hypothetical protein